MSRGSGEARRNRLIITTNGCGGRHASGARANRPGLRRALDHVRESDVLVVWKLDRLGHFLAHLIL